MATAPAVAAAAETTAASAAMKSTAASTAMKSTAASTAMKTATTTATVTAASALRKCRGRAQECYRCDCCEKKLERGLHVIPSSQPLP
jgi:hypothetical protein